MRQRRLKGVERREALNLNQLWIELTGLRFYQAEVSLHKQRVLRFVRYAVFLRDGGFRGAIVSRIRSQLPVQLNPILSHPVEQFRGEEDRRLAAAEVNVDAANGIERSQKAGVLLRRELPVELFAESRDQEASFSELDQEVARAP